MTTPTITPFSDAEHRAQVIALWRSVFGDEAGHNEPRLVIDQKVAAGDGLFFVAVAGGAVVGTIMAGYDGHRGWLYRVAVAPEHRKLGIGSRLVRHAEDVLARLGCPKINLQIVEANSGVAAFYASLGYAVEERVSMGKRMLQSIPAAAPGAEVRK